MVSGVRCNVFGEIHQTRVTAGLPAPTVTLTQRETIGGKSNSNPPIGVWSPVTRAPARRSRSPDRVDASKPFERMPLGICYADVVIAMKGAPGQSTPL